MSVQKNITAQQKKIIWSIARKGLNLDDSTLYACIMEMFSVERMSALTAAQADLLIQELRRKEYKLGERLTPMQYRGILRRAEDLGWTRKQLYDFVKKETGVDALEWIGVQQARFVITGMEKVKKWRTQKT
ncbi:MAG: phage protein GemA/Gp16 family protein [Cloacibacillus sp.]